MEPMIFKPAARYPADPRAVFILALSVFSGITALALKAAPNTLESLVPHWGVVTWGIILALGSAVTLTGMYFDNVNGIITEQVGSIMVAAAATFYSILAIVEIGPDALQNVGIILAWGLACIWRWGQLQSLLHTAYRRKVARETLEQFRDDVADGFNAEHDQAR